VRFVAINDISNSKGVLTDKIDRNLPARNTLVQLLALYTNPDSQNAQRYGRTDRRTDMLTPIADHTVYDRL